MDPNWINDFSAFLADMGKCPKGKTLDRKDNDGPYSPSNCRWANPLEQAANTSKNVVVDYHNTKMTLAAFARLIGRDAALIKYHMKKGKTPNEISGFLRHRVHE